MSNDRKKDLRDYAIIISDDEEPEIPVCSRATYDSLDLVPANSRSSANPFLKEELKLPELAPFEEQNETDFVALCQVPENRKRITISNTALSSSNSAQAVKREFFEELLSRLKTEEAEEVRKMLQMFKDEVKTGQLPKIAPNRQLATERLFGCLCLGLFELKNFDHSKLNDDAIKLIKSSHPEQYNELRRLAIKIEAQLLKCFPSMQINNIKSYTNRLSTIMMNLKDLNNPELRRKILSKQMTYVSLCTVKEEELWSDQKKLQKQKEQEKFYQSRELRVQHQQENTNKEETLIDFNLMSYRPEKKKPPEKVEEDIESKIRNYIIKNNELIRNMATNWPEKIEQDLPPSYAIKLKADFKEKMEGREDGKRLT